jgi:hypothetical protein
VNFTVVAAELFGMSGFQSVARSDEAGAFELPSFESFLKLADLKNIPAFGGEPSEWQDWKFRFETVVSMLNLDTFMQAAVGHSEEDLCNISGNEARAAKFLYALFAGCCRNRALAILRMVENRNGFVAWKRLYHEFQPDSHLRLTAMLSSILTPAWSSVGGPFLDQLRLWEHRVRTYELESGSPMDQRTLCAVFIRYAPDDVRRLVRSYPEDLSESYPKMRKVVAAYISRGRIY